MSNYRNIGILFLCVFFVIVFVLAFMYNPHFPAQAISGESSVGTWMSGVLLSVCAAVSLTQGIRKREWRWFLIAGFFLVLAADERFMFHERMKEHLIFADPERSALIYELPVFLGTAAGVAVSFLLWQLLKGKSRVLLIVAILFGAISVSMDVLTLGVLIEDGFKLMAELMISCAIVLNVE